MNIKNSEYYFLLKNESLKCGSYKSKNPCDYDIKEIAKQYIKRKKIKGNNALLIIGLPGLGKSLFYKKHIVFEKYALLDSDEIKEFLWESNYCPKECKHQLYSIISSEIVKLSVDIAIKENLQFSLSFVGHDSINTEKLIRKLLINNYSCQVFYMSGNSESSIKSCASRFRRTQQSINPDLIIKWENKVLSTINNLKQLNIPIHEYKLNMENSQNLLRFERLNVEEITKPLSFLI